MKGQLNPQHSYMLLSLSLRFSLLMSTLCTFYLQSCSLFFTSILLLQRHNFHQKQVLFCCSHSPSVFHISLAFDLGSITVSVYACAAQQGVNISALCAQVGSSLLHNCLRARWWGDLALSLNVSETKPCCTSIRKKFTDAGY